MRIVSHWQLKVFLGSALILVFWLLYFSIQRYPIFPVTEIEPSFIDILVVFNPGYVYLYESFWLLMVLPPWLMDSKNELISYCVAVSLMSLIGFAIFLLFPTSCPRPEDVSNSNAIYLTLISIDRELNAFPSLHAAFTVFSCLCCWRVFQILRVHWSALLLVIIWSIAIFYSTLATQQHLVVDLIGGTFLGVGSYVYFASRLKRNGAGER